MADDFIQLPVDGPGKRVRSYTSTGAGGNTVYSQASTIVDQTGVGMGPFVAGRLDVHIGAAGVSIAVTDGGGSLTVDTTQLPAALISGRLDVNIGASSATVPISVATLPLPTGAATNATLTDGTQKTKIVDAAGTNQATVSAAGAVKTDGSAVTQPVSDAGGSLTIDTTQLPAALVTGRLDVNIGANALDPTKLEDAAHVSGDRGNFILGVRNDTNTVLTSANGDYSPIATDSAGRVKIVSNLPTAVTVGRTTVGVAAVQIVVASTPATKEVTVKAMSTNTGIVYVGATGVTTGTGFELTAGESITLAIDDANKVYAIGSAAAQSVSWMVN